jgi:hypothetical protein
MMQRCWGLPFMLLLLVVILLAMDWTGILELEEQVRAARQSLHLESHATTGKPRVHLCTGVLQLTLIQRSGCQHHECPRQGSLQN